MLCPALQTPYDNRKGDIEDKEKEKKNTTCTRASWKEITDHDEITGS
jgi:hypothetical protein